MLARSIRDAVIILALVLAVFFAGAMVAWHATNTAPSSCPSEDSCSIDYRNGRWHIERDTP